MNAPLLVYGLGRSGRAVVARARSNGQPVAFFEARATGTDIDEAVQLGAQRAHDVQALLRGHPGAHTCVAAPGVAIDHPDLRALRHAGIEVIGEVVWMWRQLANRSIGITGTAGKGSVTRWIHHGLLHAGRDSLEGGNIDPPLAAVARAHATWVIELSSFQLERSAEFRPNTAIVLNLGVDHLDRHGSIDSYHAAKANLLRNLLPSDAFIGNDDDLRVRAWLDATPARALRTSTRHPADAWFDTSSQQLILHGTPLTHASRLQVRGNHQVSNALAVALALAEEGLSHAEIKGALESFRGLPGRYSDIGTLGGVRFVEDSIATRPLAVHAALASTPAPVVWIAGGVDKGADFNDVAPLLPERVTLAIMMGECRAQFAREAAQHVATETVDTPDGPAAMREAVARAIAHLNHHHAGQGTVLLAPLAASFDQFQDYKARAEAFKQAIAHARTQHPEVAWTPCC